MRQLLIPTVVGVTVAGSALAQSIGQGQVAPERSVSCPPDVGGDPPTVGGGPNSGPLSDRLAQSNGVICPPTGMDRDMQVTPPGGGRLKVIPPPGSPGGNRNVQPE
jgi:hypothetical protein